MKNLILVLMAIVAMTSIKVYSQEATTAPAGVEQKKDSLYLVDTGYLSIADQFGGKPWDASIKDGISQGTIITGWAVGVAAGVNSFGGINYGAFVKNYWGWGHFSLNAEVSEKLQLDKSLNQDFRSLGASADFAISILHFGGKKNVNTSGMTSPQASNALRNEKYGRMWRLYAGPSIGYQYCINKETFTYTDQNPDVDVPGSVEFPVIKDGSSIKYGAFVGVERRFSNKITKISLEGRVESYSFKSYGKSYNPVYGCVTLKIEFGLGRRPNGGKF